MKIINASAEVRHLHRELTEHRNGASPAVPSPPSTNRGGTNLHPPYPDTGSKTVIDWLSFTCGIGIVPLRIMVECLIPGVHFMDQGKGIVGYPSSYSVTLDGVPVAVIGFGASHGKDYVSISGRGCQTWAKCFYGHVRDVLEAMEAKITRLDIALDFYRAEVSFDDCLAAYQALEFKLPKARQNPTQSLVGTSLDGRNLGRTMYVGNRKGAKFVRCYEKGLEVFSRMPEDFRIANTEPGAVVWGVEQGAPASTIADQWLRVEIEFKPDQVLLDYSMLVLTDEYFAGAYPFAARVLGLGDGLRPEPLLPLVNIDLARMIRHARNGYGNLIHTLRKVGYGDTAIAEMLDTGQHNQRLVRSGVVGLLLSEADSDIPF